MKKLIVPVIAILSILTFSCKKDKENIVPTPKADYYQLKIGNYWVYREFDVDTNGVTTIKDRWDSAFIEKDTLIRGYKYFKLWYRYFMDNPTQTAEFLRDSSGYLVNSVGGIWCSDNNFTDILWADTIGVTLAKKIMKMTGKDSIVTVPAGTFQSITLRGAVIPINPLDTHPTRYFYNIFGKGVGRLESTSFFYSDGLQIQARLVRYRVN